MNGLEPNSVHRDTWRLLLAPALTVIDSLQTNGYGALDFRLGGGTVLMFRFDHRISKDVDVFTYDAQALSYISPRLNEVSEGIARMYEEHANVVKLLLAQGDIDFIVAAPVIPNAACETMEFDGRMIALDATSEILAKKLLYRAESFKARDVFDMSTVLALDRPSAITALRATTSTRPALLQRLVAMAKISEHDLMAGIVATDTGRPYGTDMVARLLAVIAEIDAAHDTRKDRQGGAGA